MKHETIILKLFSKTNIETDLLKYTQINEQKTGYILITIPKNIYSYKLNFIEGTFDKSLYKNDITPEAGHSLKWDEANYIYYTYFFEEYNIKINKKELQLISNELTPEVDEFFKTTAQGAIEHIKEMTIDLLTDLDIKETLELWLEAKTGKPNLIKEIPKKDIKDIDNIIEAVLKNHKKN